MRRSIENKRIKRDEIMTRFKTLEEFEKFKDEENICLCGHLMTGLHITYCKRLRKEELKIRIRLKI